MIHKLSSVKSKLGYKRKFATTESGLYSYSYSYVHVYYMYVSGPLYSHVVTLVCLFRCVQVCCLLFIHAYNYITI